MGNGTVSCKKCTRSNRGETYDVLSYLFEKSQCMTCPNRDTCIGEGKKGARKLQVSANASIYYKRSQRQKQPHFQEKYKKRSAQEWKNGEMKRFHGLS